MTTMTRFVPFRAPLEDVAVLQNRLNSIFHDFVMPSNGTETESLAAGNFVPAVDIYEDPHRLLLKLEVPGIRQQDLDIRVENQTLTVKGERKFAQDEREENFHRIERRFGTFVRSFTLPMTVETGWVKAVYDAGVLSITLPKEGSGETTASEDPNRDRRLPARTETGRCNERCLRTMWMVGHACYGRAFD
jgi:HSP20 family protein